MTAMRKIINEPSAFVDEVLQGIFLAHPTAYRDASGDRRAVVDAAAPRPGIVGIVTGGGSGHLPLFLGYVGPGLATAVAVGNVFSSPSPEQILRATQAVDGGAGVLYLYGNYGGDVYNFDLAGDMARAQGIDVVSVRGTDDLLSAPADATATRRGVAGLVFAYKVAGAAAARGDDLATVAALAQRCVDRTRTIGVGLAPTILPAAGHPTFVIDEGDMEFGVGIHGEVGFATLPLETADEIAARFVQHLAIEVDLGPAARLAVLVNGLGATPPEELYVLFGAVHRLVAGTGAAVRYVYVGEYATSLEMAGASVSLLALDDEFEELLEAPASSPFYRAGSVVTAPADVSTTPRADAARIVPTRGFESLVRRAVRNVVDELPGHSDELRELDAALGDGDLGITVTAGCAAVAARLDELPATAAGSAVLREVGMAFASANPSTFAALVGGGLIAASAELDDDRQPTTVDAVVVGRAVARSVAEKGGAAIGDKTLLDVLLPVLDALEADPQDLGAARATAWAQVDRIAVLTSRRGRAAWHQSRSVGLRDPGSVAVARILDALLPNVSPAPSAGDAEPRDQKGAAT